ncbi:MAG: marine proteobacterial sortase target protein [Gammaproteobacteria bacterium]
MSTTRIVQRLRRAWRRYLSLVLSLGLALPALAEAPFEDTVSIDEVERGSLLVRHAHGLVPAPLVDTDVDMAITGMLARVTVRQTFREAAGEWVNGVYVFPLPETAAVDRLRMHVGERVIEGEIKPRAAARRSFEQAQAAGRKATLVEQQRPNLFTTNVANIGPHERVVVEIEYQQTLAYEKGWFSLSFPLTVGVRYIPGSGPVGGFDGGGWSFNTDAVPDASAITPPMSSGGEGHDNPVSIRVGLNAGMPLDRIESAYHAIERTELGKGRYEITLEHGPVPADRDFELRYKPAPGHAPRAAFFRQDVGDEAYGLLMLVPPEASWARRRALPRELVFVIDTSGSMGGTSIEQARAALHEGLSRLGPADTFNVVEFNSVTRRLSPRAIAADSTGIAGARRFVDGLEANGGTEMAAALHAVLDGGEVEGRVRQVVFITDGSVGNEAELLGIIDRQLGGSRLFTVGIGSAPNGYFMREAAHHGRGTFTYIGKQGEVKSRMSALFEKLEFPVLADLRVAGSAALEVWPDPLPDLYVHEPLVASMRLADDTALELSGRLGGEAWSTRVPLTGGGATAGLDVAWARQKIASLERSIARGEDRSAVKEAITELGLRHHLVTQHTSLVAVDVTPSRPADQQGRNARVPNKMPAGWTMAPPGQRLPQTATPLALNLLLGIGSLLAAAFARWRGGRA